MDKETQNIEDNAFRMDQIQNGIDNIVDGYLKQFSAKFDCIYILLINELLQFSVQ